MYCVEKNVLFWRAANIHTWLLHIIIKSWNTYTFFMNVLFSLQTASVKSLYPLHPLLIKAIIWCFSHQKATQKLKQWHRSLLCCFNSNSHFQIVCPILGQDHIPLMQLKNIGLNWEEAPTEMVVLHHLGLICFHSVLIFRQWESRSGGWG